MEYGKGHAFLDYIESFAFYYKYASYAEDVFDLSYSVVSSTQ